MENLEQLKEKRVELVKKLSSIDLKIQKTFNDKRLQKLKSEYEGRFFKCNTFLNNGVEYFNVEEVLSLEDFVGKRIVVYKDEMTIEKRAIMPISNCKKEISEYFFNLAYKRSIQKFNKLMLDKNK